MADEPDVVPETTPADPDTFSPSEQNYFKSKGETPIETSPETAPEASETPDAEKPQEPRKVDYHALAEERTKRKETEEKLRHAEILQARMEERFRALMAVNQPQQQQPQAPPDPDKDIFGAVKHLTQEQQLTRQHLEQQYRQAQQAQQWNQVFGWASDQEAQFKKTAPDYDDALKHLRSARMDELRDLGYNENQVRYALDNDERQLILQARQANRNPAEMAYAIAKRRGFVKKDSLTEKLDTIEAGQQTSKSLSNVGGSPTRGQLSLQEVANMSEEDFAEFKTKNPAKFRRMLGAPH